MKQDKMGTKSHDEGNTGLQRFSRQVHAETQLSRYAYSLHCDTQPPKCENTAAYDKSQTFRWNRTQCPAAVGQLDSAGYQDLNFSWQNPQNPPIQKAYQNFA